MCLTAAAVNLLLIQQILRFTKFCCSHKHDSVLDDGSALSLFVFWILADYSDTSFSFDDLTFLADRFYRSSYFHFNSSLLSRPEAVSYYLSLHMILPLVRS